MKKIENLFLHADKMTNDFVSSEGFYSMQSPQGMLLFGPDDKLLTEKADFVHYFTPYFYGISKKDCFSLYKTSGKCILKKVSKISVSHRYSTFTFGTYSSEGADYHIIIWENGWYSINHQDCLTLYNEKDETLFEGTDDAKELNNGYYAVKVFDGWQLYAKSNELLAEKADDISVFANGFYAVKDQKNWRLYNSDKICLSENVREVIVRKNLYAVKRDGDWSLYRSNGELVKNYLTDVRLWDNGYYALPNDDGWKLYNQNDRLLACNALEYQVYRNGFFGARRQTGDLYFCSPDGNIITTKVKTVSDYTKNVFLVKKSESYALYNLKGKLITQSPSYIKISEAGLYSVKTGKHWQVYNLQGQLLASSASDISLDDNGCFSYDTSKGWEIFTPQGKIPTFDRLRMKICKDGYYIGYYKPFMRALYSPKGELLYKNLNSVQSLGNQQFLLLDARSEFVFFVDFSKDCLTYFQNLLKETALKNIPLTETQKQYAAEYISFLNRK